MIFKKPTKKDLELLKKILLEYRKSK